MTESIQHWRVSTHSEETFVSMDLMRSQGELCDVELQAADRSIPAHRVVLAACSPYFHSMFTSGLMESRQREIAIQAVDPEALELLVNFSYTAQITVNEENVQNLLAASTLLQFTKVRDACAKFLKNQLSPSNCLGIRSFADAHSCSYLLESSHHFALQHFGKVSQTEEFMLLPLNELLILMSSDEVNVQTEEDVYSAVVSWVQHDPDNRKQWLGEVLASVRLPLLSKEFVRKLTENDEFAKANPVCKDLLIAAMKDDLLPEQSQCRTCKERVMLVMGRDEVGEESLECYMYDSNTTCIIDRSVITPKNTLTNSKYDIQGVGVINNMIYVIRGKSGYYPLAGMSTSIEGLEVYSVENNMWSVLPSVSSLRAPYYRKGLGVTVLDGFLYVIGGIDNSVVRYDPLNGQWTSVAAMSTERRYSRVCVMDGLMYAVGGTNHSVGGTNHVVNTVECYDPKTNKWRPVPNMINKRSSHAVAVIDNKLYAVGGENQEQGTLNTMECYDPISCAWTELAPMDYYRSGHDVAVLDGILYAFGGHGFYWHDKDQELELHYVALESVEMYHPKTDEWWSVVQMDVLKGVVSVAEISL